MCLSVYVCVVGVLFVCECIVFFCVRLCVSAFVWVCVVCACAMIFYMCA